MILTTWNINGIRARENALLRRLETAEPEILCVQEIKARLEQIPQAFKTLANYDAFWNPSTFKAGYSGVGMLVHKSISRRCGAPKFSVPDFDAENRLIQAEFESFVALCFYAPRGATESHLKLKLELYDKIRAHLEALMRQGKDVLLAGDMNVAHKEIDLHPLERDETHPGFRPEERQKIDDLVATGLRDVFRDAHPNEEGLYSWWNYKRGFREKNIGWRIDCAYASPKLAAKVNRAIIEKDETGSDHAPVKIEFAS